MIRLKVTNYIDKFILKCTNNNINLYNVKKTKDYILVDIKDESIDEVKRINYQSNIEVIKYISIKSKIKSILNYKYDLFLLFLLLIFLYLLSNTIIKIEIKHEDNEIKAKVKEILKDNKIKILTFRKNNKELNNISDKIIKENKDFIEWLSITNIGMKYIVSIEDRIKPTKAKEQSYCNLISTHDAIITKINTIKGNTLVEKNKLVKKGDLLVSGDIVFDEEVKNSICADGVIYGETWYKVHISYPYKYETKQYTNNKRITIKYKNEYLYKKNYKNYDSKTLFKYKDFEIIEEREYITITNQYTYKEAKNNAIKSIKDKLLEKTGPNSKIIKQNVLKETQKNSKIELDIFVSIEQIISKRITYKVGE